MVGLAAASAVWAAKDPIEHINGEAAIAVLDQHLKSGSPAFGFTADCALVAKLLSAFTLIVLRQQKTLDA